MLELTLFDGNEVVVKVLTPKKYSEQFHKLLAEIGLPLEMPSIDRREVSVRSKVNTEMVKSQMGSLK